MPWSTSSAAGRCVRYGAHEVVDPGALTLLRDSSWCRQGHVRSVSLLVLESVIVAAEARARSATFSGVKPNSARTSAPGPEAPKWSMATESSAHRRPAEGGGRLDREHGRSVPEDLVLVVVVLLLEQLPARHGHHPGGDPVGAEQLGRVHAHRHLATRCRPARCRGPRRRRSARRRPRATSLGPLGRAFQHRDGLAGQDQGGGPVAVDGDAQGVGGLVGVGRADDPQARAWPAWPPAARWAGGSGRPRPGRPSRGSRSR